MPTNFDAIAQSRESALEINKVLRNTYSLLSMTLLFSAAVAYVKSGTKSGTKFSILNQA